MTKILSITLLALAISATTIGAQESAGRASSMAVPAALNLNTATAAQLEALPGIGKSTADRIIEYRQKSGGFKKIEDLMNVKGIGEKSFLKLKPLITVSATRAERASHQ